MIVGDVCSGRIRALQTHARGEVELGRTSHAGIPGACGLIGMLVCRDPTLDDVTTISNLVCWRIASRGTNVEALRATIRRCHIEMAKMPLFPTSSKW